MIVYHKYLPSPLLAPFIECYWTARLHSDSLHEKELIVPGGRVEVIFNFQQPFKWFENETNQECAIFRGSQVIGQRGRYYYIAFEGWLDIAGIRFKPGGLAAFTAMPVSELKNIVVPIEILWNKKAIDLEDRLSEIKDDADKIIEIEKFLTRQLPNASPDIHLSLDTISYLCHLDCTEPIDRVCERTGFYYKKLERIFLKCSGYTPKSFSAICRFQRSLKLALTSKDSFTGIGLESGYYDQSHFIRDFRKFTGTTPGEYYNRANHIADLSLQ